jgi:hypothetical protein
MNVILAGWRLLQFGMRLEDLIERHPYISINPFAACRFEFCIYGVANQVGERNSFLSEDHDLPPMLLVQADTDQVRFHIFEDTLSVQDSQIRIGTGVRL